MPLALHLCVSGRTSLAACDPASALIEEEDMDNLYTFDAAYQRLLGMDINGVEIAGMKVRGLKNAESRWRTSWICPARSRS